MHNWLDDGNERPSTAVSTDPSDPMESLDHCGGIGRLTYLLLQIFSVVAWVLLIWARTAMPRTYSTNTGGSCAAAWLTFACWVQVQRYKNLGYPWYYLFMILVPIANLYYAVLLSIGPQGYAIHKTGDKWSKIALGFILVMVILGVFVPLLITGLERRPL